MAEDEDVITRVAKLEQDVESLVASRRTIQRVIVVIIPALLGGAVTAMVYAADRIAASAERVGKNEATMEAMRGTQASQEAEISQLRAVLMRLSDDKHTPNTGGSGPDFIEPDRTPRRGYLSSSTLWSPSDTDASTGACGSTVLQNPPTQNLQIPPPDSVEHSMLLLHELLQRKPGDSSATGPQDKTASKATTLMCIAALYHAPRCDTYM